MQGEVSCWPEGDEQQGCACCRASGTTCMTARGAVHAPAQDSGAGSLSGICHRPVLPRPSWENLRCLEECIALYMCSPHLCQYGCCRNHKHCGSPGKAAFGELLSQRHHCAPCYN